MAVSPGRFDLSAIKAWNHRFQTFLIGLTMEHVWTIITKPDNIPIVGLIVLLCFFTFIALKQAFVNDKRTGQNNRQN